MQSALLSPGVVVVRGDRIVGLGVNTPVPAGSETLDLGDATLLPGFIDAHVHMASDYNENWAQGFYEGMLRLPVEQSFHAARNAKATLDAGFTTVRNVGASDFVDIVVVPGDVLQNIRSTETPKLVMKHGQVVVKTIGQR